MRIDTCVNGKVTNKTKRYTSPIRDSWEIGEKREDVEDPKPWKTESRSRRELLKWRWVKGKEHKKRQMEKSIDADIDPRAILPSKSKSADLKKMQIDYDDEIVNLGH